MKHGGRDKRALQGRTMVRSQGHNYDERKDNKY